MAECPTCGRDDFESERGMRYHHATVHDESLAKKEYNCTQCGDGFERLKYSMRNTEKPFCSQECQGKWIKENRDKEDHGSWNGGKETYTCHQCDDEFERKPCHITDGRKFCSRKCFKKWVKNNGDKVGAEVTSVTVSCETCSTEFQRIQYHLEKNNNHFCSRECYGEWLSEHNSGEDNPCWKGGTHHYYGKLWNQQREKAIERDGEQCVDCGMSRHEHYEERDKDLEVHHIQPFRTFNDSEKANKLSNLVTLCTMCHREREGRKKKK